MIAVMQIADDLHSGTPAETRNAESLSSDGVIHDRHMETAVRNSHPGGQFGRPPVAFLTCGRGLDRRRCEFLAKPS